MQRFILKFNNLDAFDLLNVKKDPVNGDISFDLNNIVLLSSAQQAVQFFKEALDATQRRIMVHGMVSIDLEENKERKHLCNLQDHVVKDMNSTHIVMNKTF